MCVLDLGSTSAANIRYLTERGHRIYSEDLLEASTDPALVTKDEHGNQILDSKQFLAENLQYGPAQFDVVLFWNLADYLDESLVKPIIARLWTLLKPTGVLLAFFHTREAGPEAPCFRYHVSGDDSLELQHINLRPDARRARARLRVSIFSGSSITDISKICSAIIPRSNSFSPATMCGRLSSFASGYICHREEKSSSPRDPL